MEELTRKPSEARLRSLLDRKYDRKHKLDTLDKQIAAWEANLATAKEQHDAFFQGFGCNSDRGCKCHEGPQHYSGAGRQDSGRTADREQGARPGPTSGQVAIPEQKVGWAHVSTGDRGGSGDERSAHGEPSHPDRQASYRKFDGPSSTHTSGGTASTEQSGSTGFPAVAHDWRCFGASHEQETEAGAPGSGGRDSTGDRYHTTGRPDGARVRGTGKDHCRTRRGSSKAKGITGGCLLIALALNFFALPFSIRSTLAPQSVVSISCDSYERDAKPPTLVTANGQGGASRVLGTQRAPDRGTRGAPSRLTTRRRRRSSHTTGPSRWGRHAQGRHTA